MTDEAEESPMLWSHGSLDYLNDRFEEFAREVKARALDLAATDGRTVVTEEDARKAIEWAIGEMTLE